MLFGNIMTFTEENKLLLSNSQAILALQKKKFLNIWIIFRAEKKREKTGGRWYNTSLLFKEGTLCGLKNMCPPIF